MVKLVSTAKAPEMAMPCPASPSLTCRAEAIGVSRLTGMNSEAMRVKTHSVMAKTPPQCATGVGMVGARWVPAVATRGSAMIMTTMLAREPARGSSRNGMRLWA